MVKMLGVIGRRPDLSHAQFVKHQLTTHLEVVDRVPEFRNRVRRYAQNHLFVDPSELTLIKSLSVCVDTDSIIEVWWDSVADMRRAFEEPRYLEIIRPDELSFGDVAGVWGVATQDTLITERWGFSGLIKIFCFLKRKDIIGHSEFLSRWRDCCDRRLTSAHAFCKLAGRFVENVVAQDPGKSLPGTRAFDVVAELWFESLLHVAEFTADPDVIAAMTGEDTDFMDRTQTLIYVAEEKPAAAEWFRKGQACT